MSQQESPRSAFKAFFDTVKTDYAKNAAGMAERAGDAVLNIATMDQATSLLQDVKKVATLAKGTDGLVKEIHDKITAKGLPIPSDKALLAFVPDTSKPTEETETPSPHPIKQIFGVIESETREEASALANSASTYFKNGEFDMGMADADRSIEVAKKSTEINTLAGEIVALVTERGYKDLSPGILERTAIMMHGQQYREQSALEAANSGSTETLTTPIQTTSAIPTPFPFLAIDRSDFDVSPLNPPAQPAETPAATAEPQAVAVTPKTEITTPPPAIVETNISQTQGAKETEVSKSLLEISLNGNELTLKGRTIPLTDDERTILLRIPLKGQGIIKGAEAGEGLFKGYDFRNKYSKTLNSIRAKLAFVSGNKGSIHSVFGNKGGVSLEGAVIKVIEPETTIDIIPTTPKSPDTRAANWIDPLPAPVAPAELKPILGPEQPAASSNLAAESPKQPEPEIGQIQLTIAGDYLIHEHKRIKLDAAEIAILERLPDIKEGYKRGPEIGEGLFPGYVFKNKFKKVYNALRKKLDDLTGRDVIKTQKGIGGGLALDGAVIVRPEVVAQEAVAQTQTEQTKAEPVALIETQAAPAPEAAPTPIELPAAVIEPALPSQEIPPAETVKISVEIVKKSEIGEGAKTDISVKEETIIRTLLPFDEKANRYEQTSVRTAVAEIYKDELAALADEAARRDQEITYAVQVDSQLRTLASKIVEGRNRKSSGDITGYENLVALAKWVDGLSYQKKPLYSSLGVNGLFQAMSRGYSFDVLKEISQGINSNNKNSRNKNRRLSR